MNSLPDIPSFVEPYILFDELASLLPRKTGRKPRLSVAEAATIGLIRHRYGCATWKQTYVLLCDYFSTEFHLPCYKNFVTTMNQAAPLILTLINGLLALRQSQSGEVIIMDSTPLPVCRNGNITRHKTMKAVASRAHSSTGWFYGLKLHATCTPQGQLLSLEFTTASVDDRKPLDALLEHLNDTLILADAGYCSKQLERKASIRHNRLLTGVRKTMRKLATHQDVALLRLRGRIEVLFAVLKERCALVTSLPRSISGYLGHYVYAIFGHLFSV